MRWYFHLSLLALCGVIATQMCAVTIATQSDMSTQFSMYTFSRCGRTKTKEITARSTKDFVGLLSNVSYFKGCAIVCTLGKAQLNILSALLFETHRVQPLFAPQSIYPSESNCNDRNQVYLRAILHISMRLDIHWIGIVSQDEACAVLFAHTLKHSIEQHDSQHEHYGRKVKIYTTPFTYSPMELLHEFHTLPARERVYIMLTPEHITSIFFKNTHIHSLGKNKEVWVVKHAQYENIAPVTITYSQMSAQIARPLNGNLTQAQLCQKNRAFVEKLHEPDIYIRFWRAGEWEVIYKIQSDGNAVQIQSYIGEIRLKESLGIIKSEPLKIVSIIEGPFLYHALYLINKNNTMCEENSKLCKIPTKENNRTTWEISCCFGYSVDLIKMLEDRTQITMQLYVVEDGSYGKLIGRSYNGMLGDVIRGKADMAVAGLTISSVRAEHVDFTTPFMRAEMGIITLLNSSNADYINLNFIANLGAEARYSIVVLFLTAIIAICMFDNFTKYQKWKVGLRFVKFSKYKWQDCFFYVTGLVFQRDVGGINPTTMGGRTVSVFFAFAMVAWTTLYTASLTAEQVVQGETTIFKGLTDKRMSNPTTDFIFATAASTSIEEFFKNAPDETLNRMSAFMNKYNVKNVNEGINKVLSGELHAFLNEYPFLLYALRNLSHCNMQITPATAGQSFYGIAVAKNSSLKAELSAAILHFQEEGELSALRSKWLSRCTQTNMIHQEFSLVFFATPLILLASFIGVSAIILAIEISIIKCCHQHKKSLHITGSIQKKPSTWENLRTTSIISYAPS